MKRLSAIVLALLFSFTGVGAAFSDHWTTATIQIEAVDDPEPEGEEKLLVLNPPVFRFRAHASQHPFSILSSYIYIPSVQLLRPPEGLRLSQIWFFPLNHGGMYVLESLKASQQQVGLIGAGCRHPNGSVASFRL